MHGGHERRLIVRALELPPELILERQRVGDGPPAPDREQALPDGSGLGQSPVDAVLEARSARPVAPERTLVGW
jgi:hypothetical protein